jgi:hypothetical protein
MRTRLCAAVAVLLAVVACQHDKAAPVTPATPTDVIAAGKATVEQWRQAQEVRSMDMFEKLYAHDGDVVLVQDGLPMVGWTFVDQAIQARMAHAKEIHIKLKDVTVSSIAPTIAGVSATMTREISDGVTTVTENGALTLVLRNTANGWQIVQEHYSYKR